MNLASLTNPITRAPNMQERAVIEAMGHRQAGRNVEALRVLDHAVKRSPMDAQLVFNAGVIAMEIGQTDVAIQRYESVCRLKPSWWQAHNNLAHCYSQLGRYQDTITAAEKSISLNPRDALAYVNLCGALLATGREEEAAEAGRKAVKIDPRNYKAHLNLGVAYRALWDLQRAEKHYREVTTLAPNYANGWADLAQAFSLQGRLREAVQAAEISAALEPQNPIMRANLILYKDTAPDVTLRDSWAERRVYNALFTRPLMMRGSQPHDNNRNPDRPLRVGYVSADFRRHSAGYALLPLIEHHDPTQQEIFLYYGGGFRDDLTDRFEAAAEHLIQTQQMDDERLVKQIRSDKIDILIDLSTYTSGTRLSMFARRPAPIQATGWGYATGTGLDCFDILFSDDVTIPPEAEPFYSEAVVRLPAIIPYTSPDDAPEPGPLPMIANGYPTFGSMNRLEKVTPEILAVWGQVMAAVPTAKLMVKFSGLDSPSVAAEMTARMASVGIAADRLELIGHTSRQDHLEAIMRCDLLLDPWPHGGGITTLEALSVGVPCVTLLGDRVPGRLSASFLARVGLGKLLVAESAEQYVAMAAAAVETPDVLGPIRAALPKALAESPMCQHKSYVESVEAAMRGAWHQYLAATERRAAA